MNIDVTLTSRELEILRLRRKRTTYKQIATDLGYSQTRSRMIHLEAVNKLIDAATEAELRQHAAGAISYQHPRA